MKRTLRAVALFGVLAGYLILMWRGPWMVDGGHLRTQNLQPADGVIVTGFRTTLVALGAGVIACLGLYYTHHSLQHTRARDREQAELTREGQVTDRYVEAIKLLSGDHPTQRLGGIYSLERIMRDSAKDHTTVVAVLAGFIRQHARLPEGGGPGSGPVTEEIQAALTVLGRRPAREEPTRLDLRRTNLPGADLTGARFGRARLADCDLSHADLRDADLENAWLPGADLTGSFLTKAVLSRANLRGAGLDGAVISGARLRDTDLRGTDLRRAKGYGGAEQLGTALTDATTALPPSG
ncbi:pentapeptide repeat-containing protein [Streptomyces sp. NBC_00096]|uniref:pentapeptide repeat-containing protein n=1 Tax=Streptomyces sp. NBC_00096 TaxID=2975650 RepID=UPI0032510488